MRRPPRSTLDRSSAASDVYKRQVRANNRSYYAEGIQTVLDFNFITNDISHDINIGFRYHKDEIDRFQWDDLYAMNNGCLLYTSWRCRRAI